MHRGQGHVGEGQEIEGVALPPNTISVVHPVDHNRASGASFWPQKSKCICRQLDPEKAFLRTTLKKRSADISCPQEPAHIGSNGEQPTPRKSRGSRTARLQIAMKGIHISIATYNQTGFCSWASIRLFAPRKKHSRCQRSGWISI